MSLAPTLRRHPLPGLALKSAFAAGAAWLLVQPLGGIADDYPYYAPLGAVVAMSGAVVASVRSSAQAVAAIVLGGCLALAVRPLPTPPYVGVVLVVAVGTLLSGLRPLGSRGSWAVWSALFVLVIGGQQPGRYVLAYAGLTGLGAVVGVVVTLAFPQLPALSAGRARAELRQELVRQLRAMSDAVEAGDANGAAGDETLRRRTERLDRMVTESRQARRGNWRAHRRTDLLDRQESRARALETLARLVEDVGALLSEAPSDADALSREVRRAVSCALRSVSDMLVAVDEADGGPGEAQGPRRAANAADEAVDSLRHALADRPAGSDDPHLAGAAIAVTLRRAIDDWR